MLRWRLASAAVIISVLLALVWLDFRKAGGTEPGVWLMPILLLVAGVGAAEVLDLLRSRGQHPDWLCSVGGSVFLCATFFVPMWPTFSGDSGDTALSFEWTALVLVAVTMLLFAVEMARFREPGSSINNVAFGLLTVVYVGGLSGFLALLRHFQAHNGWGIIALVSTLVITKFADTGAYAVGKTLGRTKLTPILSPGKTVEGAIGGVLAACLASWLMLTYVAPLIVSAPQPAAWRTLVYGLLLALAGMHGDLAESLLKRDMQRKDSSTWLRGLGGVLDIIDSVLFAAPVAYFCWTIGLIGPRQ